MKKFYKNFIAIFFIILTLVFFLFSCVKKENENPYEKEGFSSLNLSQQSKKYDSDETVSGYSHGTTFLDSMVMEKIIEYETNGYEFLIFREPFGEIMAAGGKDCISDIFLSIADETYVYPTDNIEIAEFKNVLGNDGVTISYLEGANSRPIIYLSCRDNGIYPLAICNKSNYEVDVNGDDINDLITCSGWQTNIIYMSDGELYIADIGEALYKELNTEDNPIDNVIAGYYDVENDIFEISVYKDEKETRVKAFVENNILYYKNE